MKAWILLAILISTALVQAKTDPAALKSIKDLQKVLDTEEMNRAKFENDLKDLMIEIQNVDLAHQNFDVELERIQNRVQDVKSQMTENQLRIDFLNGFINALDRHPEPTKNLAVILLDLSHRQVSSAIQNSTESKLWLFELYLSMAIKSYYEPSEGLGEFVKHYMSYSSIFDPKTPRGFGKSREYLSFVDSDKDREPSTAETASAPPP